MCRWPSADSVALWVICKFKLSFYPESVWLDKCNLQEFVKASEMCFAANKFIVTKNKFMVTPSILPEEIAQQ